MPLDTRKPANYRRAPLPAGALEAAGNIKVTVCANCSRASCWQGEFYCDEAKTSSTKEVTLTEAQALALEHPHWWLKDENVKQHLFANGSRPTPDEVAALPGT